MASDYPRDKTKMLKQQISYYPQTFQQRNWLRPFSTLLPFFGAVLWSMLVPSDAQALTSGVTITSITPYAALDSNSSCSKGPRGMYLQVNVENTSGVTLTGLSANIDSFSNSSFTLDSGESATRYIGNLDAGKTTSLYWYVNYPCQSGKTFPTTNYTVTLSNSTPGTVTSSTFTLTTRSEISAEAGGDIKSALIGAGAVPGQIIPYTVNYDFGNPGNSAEAMIQPAGNISFDSSCYRLINTDITSSSFSAGPTTTNDNRLYFTGVNGGSSNTLTVVYYFISLCNGAGTTAQPFADLTSGNDQKYTGNYTTSFTFPSSTNPFTITKSASPATLPTGGTVTYTITIDNPSGYTAIIDRITDILPSNVTYGSLVTGTGNTSPTIANDSSSQPTPGVSTGIINWVGNANTSYSLPAGGSLTLKYTANVPNVVGSYTNSAKATAGSSSTAPATATVNVGVSDLTLTKTHTGNFTVGSPGSYALTVNNIGTAPSTGTVTVTDTLPGGLTIPNGSVTLTGTNAANWSCSAASNVITCSSTTAIATSGSSSFNLTGIQVGSAAVPSVTNTAVVAGGSEANDSNNSATDSTTVTVPPTIDLDGNNSSGATGNDFKTSFALGGSAIAVVDANTSSDESLDTVITDSDSPQLSKAEIKLTNAQTNDLITVSGSLPTGITLDPSSTANQIILTGTATRAEYETALEQIRFSTTSSNLSDRTVTVQVTDNTSLLSNLATATIAIARIYDYGDAPDAATGTGTGNYKTTSSDGGAAQVKITTPGQVLSLGSNLDIDDGSLQNSSANADDNNGSPDDEDGVTTFPVLTTLAAQTYVVPVSVSNNVSQAYLVGYIDFNKDGDFDDSGEKSATVTVSSSSTNPRTFNVTFTTPTGMTTGNTYARFRLGQVQATAQSSIGASGSTDYGEIEDYQIAIAPTPPVATNTSSSCSSPATLISSPEFTLNSANYSLNSALQTSLPLSLYNGTLKFNATLSGTGTWSGGVQLRNDPSFGNHIFLQPQNTNGYLTSGNKATYEFSWQTAVSSFSMVVGGLNNYDGTTISASYKGNPVAISAANFSNLSTGMTLSDTNIDTDNDIDTVVSSNTTGETQVTNNFYTLTIPGPIDKITVLSGKETSNNVSTATIGFALIGYCGSIDYGDAPDTYGTNSTNNNSEGVGAKHLIVDTLKLGSNAPDAETDAQTPLDGTGDGTDEDGITIFPSLNTGNNSYSLTATVSNTTGSAANVYAWVDFDLDGKFDGDERATVSNGSIILSNGKVPTNSNGTVTLTWSNLGGTGANMVDGNSYARIRLTTDNLTAATTTTTRDLASVGIATNGEVEDYPIAIAFRENTDLPPNFCQALASSRNLLFILDDSSSVDPTELQQQRDAIMATLNDFVTKNLTGKAAIVAFDSVGKTVIDYTDITAANLSNFQTALSTNYGDDGEDTHWEKGFQAGIDLPGGTQPNVVFFFTDGMNNSGNNPDGKAAQFKAAGAHIYGIGIAGLTVDDGFKGITNGNNTITYNGSNALEADFLPITDYGTLQNQYTNTFLANLCPADFGDAPDTYGTNNIANNSSNNSEPLGVNHDIVPGLFLGATAPDTDANGFVDGTDDNSNATDDDDPTGTGTGNGDDEGNFIFPALSTGRKSYTIPLGNITVTNTTGQSATLHAWIDFDNSGTFEPTEYASATVGTSGSNPQANLTWTGISIGTVGNTYARFRLTSDNSINNSTPGGNASDGEVEDYQIAIAQASDPNLLLVKRITAINPGQLGEIRFNNFTDDPGTTNDNNPKWPNVNNYLRGEISVPQVKPGDEVEYTIYFLSNGEIAAKDVKICDAIPDNMTFNKHSYGTEVGISLILDPTNLSNNTNKDLSNLIGDDQGSFYAPGTNPPLNLCKKHDPSDTDNLVPHNLISVDGSTNLSGAVLIHLINPLPPATAPGTPTNSYGFVRFRAKVK